VFLWLWYLLVHGALRALVKHSLLERSLGDTMIISAQISFFSQE